jgi:MFS family permease
MRLVAWSVELALICANPLDTVAYLSFVFYLGRTMQGLACAGFIPAGIGILASLYYPGRRKNRVFSAFSAAQPLGGGIGGMCEPPSR